MFAQRPLLIVLLLSHLLMNTVWASVHMAVSDEVGFEPLHLDLHSLQHSKPKQGCDLDPDHNEEHHQEHENHEQSCHAHALEHLNSSSQFTISCEYKSLLNIQQQFNQVSPEYQPLLPPPSLA